MDKPSDYTDRQWNNVKKIADEIVNLYSGAYAARYPRGRPNIEKDRDSLMRCAKRCYEENILPKILVENKLKNFPQQHGGFPPLNHVCGPANINAVLHMRDNPSRNLALEVDVMKKFWVYQVGVLNKDPREILESPLIDLSAAFKYAIAVVEGFDDLVSKYKLEALQTFARYPQYRKLLSDLLPEEDDAVQ